MPPWEPDTNSAGYGTLSFFDAAGHQVTGGTNLNHLFDYAVASTASARTTTKATLFFGFPDKSKTDSLLWYSTATAGPTTFPIAGAPGDVAAVGSRPVVKLSASEGNLASQLSTTTLDQNAGYKDIVQIRLRDSGPGNPSEDSFWGADIAFDKTANTWSQVYPAVAAATSTTLTAAPNPSTVGDTVTLSATVSPTAAGTVQFSDGASTIGSPVAVNAAGVATTTTSSLTAGTHSLSAVFTPSSSDVAGSTGTASATVNPPATATSTTLAVSGGYATAGSDTTLTANVTGPGTTPNGAGTVAFYDNGAASPIPGSVSSPSTGTYVLDVPNGFTAGAHSVVAKFTPTSVTQYQVSQSAPQAFTSSPDQGSPCGQSGAQCTDPQSITATVPVGTLVIDTPYTPAYPLDLGTLALSSDSTQFAGSASFDNIKVTDTRSGNQPWTAKALASPLTNGRPGAGNTINGENLGLTNLVATPGTGFAGVVTTQANAVPAHAVAADDTGSAGLGGATAHTIATADHGLGTVTMKGLLTLVAPSSTQPGLYTGTITFTVG